MEIVSVQVYQFLIGQGRAVPNLPIESKYQVSVDGLNCSITLRTVMNSLT